MLIWGRGTEVRSAEEKARVNAARPVPLWLRYIQWVFVAYVIASYIVATGVVVLWSLDMFGVGMGADIIIFLWALAPLAVLGTGLVLPTCLVAVIVWFVLAFRGSSDGA